MGEVARHHDVDSHELYRSVRRLLERGLLGNPIVTTEMGRAMLRLAQAQVGAGDIDTAEHDAVLSWLHGELRSIAALRPALIYTRIGRHNARSMLTSTAALLLAAGHGGLIVHIDYARLAEARRRPAAGSSGLLLGGGFGAGKSHLLTHLGHLAMSDGFVVSTVVISKETPLHDPVKTFRAAIQAAMDPARGHEALADAAASLDPDTPRYAELSRWVTSPAGGLDERFAAILLCHERLRGGDVPGSDETVDALVRFWGGEPLRVAELRRALRSVGAARLYSFAPITIRDLALQRFRFAARLLRAAGHTGWVILFDEVELIGRYSLLQRGRAYAELAMWFSSREGDPGLPLVPVFAMTDDFEAAVLTGKDDRTQIPARLRAKESPQWDETAALAEAGMRHIEHDMLLLEPPNDHELDHAYAALKKLYADAFGWNPPDVAGLERLGATCGLTARWFESVTVRDEPNRPHPGTRRAGLRELHYFPVSSWPVALGRASVVATGIASRRGACVV